MKGDSKKLLLQAMLTDVRAQLVSAFHRALQGEGKETRTNSVSGFDRIAQID